MSTANTTSERTHRSAAAQKGPPLLAPALAFTALTIIGLVLGSSGPRPNSPPGHVLAYLTSHPTTATLLAVVVFGGSIPLAIWSAVAYRRLRQLGVTAPGTAIGLVGGLLSAASLALSGLVSWTAVSSAELGDAVLVRALSTLSFATGGPGFVAPFALLIAGVAVPSLILRLLPRPLAWAGLVIAGLGMLTVLSLLVPPLFVLLPIGRFLGLAWIVAASALLPRTRPRRTTPQPRQTPPAEASS